jgi:hypothetical protein
MGKILPYGRDINQNIDMEFIHQEMGIKNGNALHFFPTERICAVYTP